MQEKLDIWYGTPCSNECYAVYMYEHYVYFYDFKSEDYFSVLMFEQILKKENTKGCA